MDIEYTAKFIIGNNAVMGVWVSGIVSMGETA